MPKTNEDQKVTPVFSRREDRREAIKSIIRQLPGSVQPYLVELFHTSEAEASRETELFSALRSTLNSLTQEGALPRRTFLQIAGLVVSGGLAPLLYPEKAHAWQQWTGFWQNIQNNSYVTSANTGTDPYWDYVVLLMNMDGINGSTVFADESNIGRSPTLAGTPYIDTGAGSSPYSGRTGSAKMNGSTDYVEFADAAELRFGASDFCFECYFKWSGNTSANSTLFGKGDANQSSGIVIRHSGSNGKFSLNTGNSAILNSVASLSANTWYHVALTRSGTTVRLFINGSLDSSATGSWDWSATTALRIGCAGWSTNYCPLDGWISDVRIYNGVAKYTANFTPNTAPIGLGSSNDSNWGYCVLACPFENSLKDMSGKRSTANGSVALSTAAKKFGSASASFNGSNQYLSLTSSSDFILSGDFTIEAFVYLPSSTSSDNTYHTIINLYLDDNNYVEISKARSGYNGGRMYCTYKGAGSYAQVYPSSVAPVYDSWFHITAVRSGGTLTLYQDGVAIGSTSSTQILSGSPIAYVGVYCSGGSTLSAYHQGYIDSLRITKGYARYLANFTPPTAAFPVGKDESVDPFWSYTVLAMHMDDLTDATGRHTITNNNSVTNNTTTYKFGTASSSLNGSNQSLTHADSTDWTFEGDFTIECWVKTSADGGIYYRGASTAGLTLGIGGMGAWGTAGNSGKFGIGFVTNGPIYSSTTVSNGVWHHLAAVRSGATIFLFVDGIKENSATNSTVFNQSNILSLGNYTAVNSYLNGYLDDLRITKGLARYVQSFTPPTRAFVNGGVTKTLDTRTWISGSSPASASAAATYGTQGTGSTSNTPSGRQGPVSWTDSSGNLWLFGGTGLDSASANGPLNDLWKFNPTTLQWTWVSGPNTGSNSGTYGTQGTASTSNIPRARYASTSWIDSSGNLWLFGGLSYGAASLNDLWKFNPTTLEWTWVSGSSSAGQSGTYGTQGTASGSNVPGARYNPTSWIDSSGNFWIFGGYGNASSGSGRLNDLWKFNPTTLQWTWVAGASSTNQNGTYGSLGAPSSSNVPGGRAGSAAWIDSSGNLWLFGGNGYDSAGTQSYLNDLWKFNPSNNQWTWMGGSNTAGQSGTYGTMGTSSTSNIPGARVNSVASIDLSNNVYLFGGNGKDSAGSSGGLNDLWKLNLSNNQWTWIAGASTKDQAGTYGTKGTGSTSNMPGARSQAALWIDSTGVLWLFSGSAAVDFAVNSNALNDLWKLS